MDTQRARRTKIKYVLFLLPAASPGGLGVAHAGLLIHELNALHRSAAFAGASSFLVAHAALAVEELHAIQIHSAGAGAGGFGIGHGAVLVHELDAFDTRAGAALFLFGINQAGRKREENGKRVFIGSP